MYIVQRLLYIDRVYWPGEQVELSPAVAQPLVEQGLLQAIPVAEPSPTEKAPQEPTAEEGAPAKPKTKAK